MFQLMDALLGIMGMANTFSLPKFGYNMDLVRFK